MAETIFPLNLDRAGPIWSWFDAELYARSDAAAAAALRDGPAAALADFIGRGAAMLRAPNLFFDARYYVDSNADVAEGVRSGAVQSAYDHFASVGWVDRNPHWLFDIGRYARLNQDLTPGAVAAHGGLYGHYLSHGDLEGRSAHVLFNSKFYLSRVPEAEMAAAAVAPFAHYLDRAGAAGPERRTSPYFDPAWYLATYPEAGAEVASQRSLCALQHYVLLGSRVGLDPLCDFSEAEYLHAHADVADAVRAGHFRNGYDHFINYGVHDPRPPSRAVDLLFYSRQGRVARDMATGRFGNVFEHLLLVGLEAGLPLLPPVPNRFHLPEAETRRAFISQAQRALPGYGRDPLDFTVADGMAAVSVIIVLRNQFALTMQCLASLRQNFAGGVELIIVDNASSDGTVDIGELVRGARIIRSEVNTGFLRACNMALEHVTAPAVLYLNNDVVLHPGSTERALRRLWSEPTIGAVGGKIVRTHGMLQEAGCIVWRDGGTDGWMRDAPPDAPEANYVRDVDFCSGCFLLLRAGLLKELGGFDDAFAPAYYEETDLCLRVQRAGFRIVYDPAVSLTHLEYASSRSVRAATSQMVVNREVLRKRHGEALRRRPVDRATRAEAAGFATRGRRVLFIEDTIPLHRLGSGYGRAADVLAGLVAAGWQATVFPMIPVVTPAYRIAAALPDTVEALWDRDRRSLRDFMAERRGFYDLIWVSRAHNLRQLFELVGPDGVGQARVVLDTEAVFSVRDRALAELQGLPFDMVRALGQELESAWLCDHVVAVTPAEAELIAEHGGRPVGTLGFRQVLRPQAEPFAGRRGVLFVGALAGGANPNVDGLRWYLEHVHPVVENMLGPDEARLTVAGHVADGLDLLWLSEHPGVEMLGPVTDLTPLYARHRVFVAPTRFAAGIPVKVLEATSFGLPVVCTELLRRQLGWEDGTAVLAAPEADPDAFAAAVARLYDDPAVWKRVRAGGLKRLQQDASPEQFARQLQVAVAAAGVRVPAVPAREEAPPPPAPPLPREVPVVRREAPVVRLAASARRGRG